MFTFDVDAAIGNGTPPVANSANSANPTTETPPVSRISKISNPIPPFSMGHTSAAINDQPATIAADERGKRLLAMLEANPEARYAIMTADDGKGPVIVAVAIRGAAMAEYEIERSRYDGIALLELIERHGATIH